MDLKRFLRHDPEPLPEHLSAAEVDAILTEIGGLYREQFRAHYNGDVLGFQKLAERIRILKDRLNETP